MITAEKRQIKFVRVDEWNRPVFEVLGKKNTYLTDVNNLFSEAATEQEVKNFYKPVNNRLEKYLVGYGNSSNVTDPCGYTLKSNITLELI